MNQQYAVRGCQGHRFEQQQPGRVLPVSVQKIAEDDKTERCFFREVMVTEIAFDDPDALPVVFMRIEAAGRCDHLGQIEQGSRHRPSEGGARSHQLPAFHRRCIQDRPAPGIRVQIGNMV
ncbi:MAG: hypothetical protein R6V60_21425 [Desulfobacterales bacterium]